MIIIETHEYRFPSHLLPALINGDPIIDETDQNCFDAFINGLERLKIKYHAISYTIDYELDSYFSHTNCLFNLGCDVTDIKIHFFR